MADSPAAPVGTIPSGTPNQMIVDTVETGVVHVAGQVGEGAGRMVVAEDSRKVSQVIANPRYEYVSGGSWSWTASFLRTLAWYIDDTTRDLGDDLYDRMMLDPQVATCINLLKLGVMAQGVSLKPAVKPDHPDYDKALEIQEFVSRVFEELETPLPRVLWNMLDALAVGNKIAEQVYDFGTGQDKGKLILKAIKVKPRRASALVVDVYLNVVGVLGLIPGQGAPVLVEGMIGEPGQVPNLLPRSKFCVFTNRGKDSDPRGSSHARPAYNAWYLKMQQWPEYLAALTQFGRASLIGYLPENSMPLPLTDALGNVQLDSQGNPIMVQPAVQMLNALQAVRNGAAAVFPHGAMVTPLLPQDEAGKAFEAAVNLLNKEIAKGILCNTRSTEEAEHGSKADSQTGQDVTGLVIAESKTECITMLDRDVIRALVLYNFGPDLVRLRPKASLGGTETQDFPETAKAVAALQTSGFLDPSQYPDIDATLNLPVRVEREEEDKEAELPAQPAAPGASPSTGAPPGQTTGKPSNGPNGGVKMVRLSEHELGEYLGFGRLDRELRDLRRAA